MLTLADILEAQGWPRVGAGDADILQVAITAVVIDSRQAVPRALFVALPGEQVDGHDFVADAFAHGAQFAFVQRAVSGEWPVLDLCLPAPEGAAALAALPAGQPVLLRVADCLEALQQTAAFWRRKFTLRVIGITGSVGKSTTKELTAAVLGQRYATLKNLGNLNNEIGLPLTLLRLDESCERAVLEMGFYVPGEIRLLCELAQPVVGVITNIGTVHAERAGSQEAIARGKAELVQALPAEGVAILNYDDPWVLGMAAQTAARVFTYGLDPRADLWADGIEGLGLEGIRFRLHYQHEVLSLRVPLIGQHSVHTALRATAVGLVEGLTWEEIIRGLRSGNTQLRLAAARTASGALLLDDTYNATPESSLAALNLLQELEGRHVAVLGDMLELGQYEQRGHEMVGVRAAEVAQLLVTVGPRAHTIARAARAAGMAAAAVIELDDNQEAIDWLQTALTAHDTVLVKGSRGMRMDRIVAALEAGR